MPSKLEQLKKEIQRVRPEIMELKFGCKIQLKEDVSIDKVKYYCIVKREKESYQLYNSRNGSIFWKTKQNFHEILGRPITLEDVLKCFIKACPPFPQSICLETNEAKKILSIWQLGKPLHEQSEDTINFLFSLIVK